MRFRAIVLAAICAVIGAAMITNAATAGQGHGNKHGKKHKKKKKNKQQGKISICHQTGNGSFVLITVGFPALSAHAQHGDRFPVNGGCANPVEPTRFSSGPTLDFGPNGWGGWSCPLDMRAIGGGSNLADVTAAGIAAPGATLGNPPATYPTFPHHTFSEAAGETGFVVQNDNDTETGREVFVLCVPK
jgi:hypothetical protein